MNPFVKTAFALLALLATAAPVCAEIAGQRAVCSVRLVPGTSEGLGRSGGLVITTKARYQDCSDNFAPLAVHMLCTASPSNAACTTDARFHYTESALLAVYHVLVEARHALDTVDIFFQGAESRGQQVRVGRD